MTTTTTAMLHRCCAPHCNRRTLLGYVACRTHWQRVPADVRMQLGELFRHRLDNPTAYVQAVDLARQFVARHA